MNTAEILLTTINIYFLSTKGNNSGIATWNFQFLEEY